MLGKGLNHPLFHVSFLKFHDEVRYIYDDDQFCPGSSQVRGKVFFFFFPLPGALPSLAARTEKVKHRSKMTGAGVGGSLIAKLV